LVYEGEEMRRAILACALLLPSLLALGCQIPGQGPGQGSVLAGIIERGTLRIGMSGTQPPLNGTSRSGKLIGLEADLGQMLANAMGVRAELIAHPFPELLDRLEAGELDVVMSGFTITAPRNMRVAFAGPYFVSGKSILTSSKVLADARTPSDINAPTIRLAALRGSTSQSFVEVLVPQAELTTTSDYEEAIEWLRNGRIDALVADYPICLISALRYRDEGFVTLGRPLSMEPVGVAMPAGDSLFINLVQNYLNALHQTGIMAELRAKWVDDEAWLAELMTGQSI
jgi:polar amino acid transport system substrate-binding protein